MMNILKLLFKWNKKERILQKKINLDGILDIRILIKNKKMRNKRKKTKN